MSLFKAILPQPILHSFIRHKAALHKTPIDRFRVCIAHDLEQHQDAFTLLHIAYVFQGLQAPRGVTMRITPQHVLPESTVLVAYEGDAIVGTMTVTLDSPAGLPLDKDYKKELDSWRDQGDLLVEFGSLAVVRRCWHDGVTTLLNMAAFWWSHSYLNANRLVMGINPSARDVYAALFCFKPLGPPQPHVELTAPVQGFTSYVPDIFYHFEKYGQDQMSDGTTVDQAFRTLELPCFKDIPRALSKEELARWKLPRSVFKELFVRQSDHLDSLDPDVRDYLSQWRTPKTLGEVESGIFPNG